MLVIASKLADKNWKSKSKNRKQYRKWLIIKNWLQVVLVHWPKT